MAHQVIKQPNGLYALWSTVIDDFLLEDSTPEEIIECESKYAREDLEAEMKKIIASINQAGRYRHFMTWEEAIELKKEIHDK